ncbi:MAG: hypothetical protein VKJ86_13080 [Synechococcus sp.]|nr:hypothetical protein [Synechococcus sp.]
MTDITDLIFDTSLINLAQDLPDTSSRPGGVNLFAGLDDAQTPVILQAFPTTNLSGLLSDGASLAEGETVSTAALESIGFSFGDIIEDNGVPTVSPLEVTEYPGVKFARPEDPIAGIRGFENLDLLNVLVNPDLEGDDYDRSYLNSLYWTLFPRAARIDNSTLKTDINKTDWYQLYVTRPHNRGLLQYNTNETASVEYSEVFSNPGVSLTIAEWGEEVDGSQSLNASLGLLIGGLFSLSDGNGVQEALDEGKEKFAAGEAFGRLDVNDEDREVLQQANQRLNKTLVYSQGNSRVRQNSGRLTFNAYATSDKSGVWQLRTGLYPRRVQQNTNTIFKTSNGEAFFSKVETSQFGPLTYQGLPVPEDFLSSGAELAEGGDSTTRADVILTTPGGERFLARFEGIPLGVRSADIAFDNISISRIDELENRSQSYEGLLFAPTVELTYAGSSDKWTYALASGLWALLDKDSAPGIDDDFEIPDNEEDTIGAFIKGSANALRDVPVYNDENTLVSVRTYGPSFGAAVDTSGDLNLNISYQYGSKTRSFGWTIRPSIYYAQGNVRGDQRYDDLTPVLFGQLGWQNGFSLIGNFEFGDDTFANIVAQQKLAEGVTAGLYYQSFNFNTTGLRFREDGYTVGGLLRYSPTDDSRTYYETRVGGGESGLDIDFRSRFTF